VFYENALYKFTFDFDFDRMCDFQIYDSNDKQHIYITSVNDINTTPYIAKLA